MSKVSTSRTITVGPFLGTKPSLSPFGGGLPFLLIEVRKGSGGCGGRLCHCNARNVLADNIDPVIQQIIGLGIPNVRKLSLPGGYVQQG